MKLRPIAGMAAAIVLAMSLVTGASAGKNEKTVYNTGNAVLTVPVDELDIEWAAGSVTVQTHRKDTIEIAETAGKELSTDEQMHWTVEKGELKIVYQKPGMGKGFSISSLFGAFSGKDLTVTLPETLVLRKVGIESASAPVSGVFNTAELDIETASGAVRAQTGAADIEVETASGKVELTHSGTADKVGIESASGAVEAVLGMVGSFEGETASGKMDVRMEGFSRECKFETASGKIDASFGVLGKKLGIESASGNITLTVPEDAGFTARFSSFSGKIECGIPVKTSGKNYIAGDGSTAVDIETASGSVTVKALVR